MTTVGLAVHLSTVKPSRYDKDPLDINEKSTVPNGHIFVLGDNKDNAEDSRRFGPVPLSDVIGVARQIWFNANSPSIFDRIGKPVT